MMTSSFGDLRLRGKPGSLERHGQSGTDTHPHAPGEGACDENRKGPWFFLEKQRERFALEEDEPSDSQVEQPEGEADQNGC